MKQVVQYPRSGDIRAIEVPSPALQEGGVLVRTAYSVLSPGTERSVLEFGRQSLVGKALKRPDLVRRVVRSVARDGLVATVRDVRERLEQPVPLGYSSVGTVFQVGSGVDGVNVGDVVACGGSLYAYHAEVIFVPKNLVAKVPAGVSAEHAAFTAIGAIALQGVRIGEVTLGDRVAVVGLGLVGQLAVQVAKAAGAKVLGIDLNPSRVEVARKLGADMVALRSEAEAAAARLSDEYGMDVVLLTAATPANDPVELAAAIAREKARVVVVGDVGLGVPRTPFYAKELELRLSRSYGPGRYDPDYEEKGLDYPYSYVRWTEQRNMAAFLELVAAGSVQLAPLITHRFPVTEAAQAYHLIQGDSKEESLGVVLVYDTEKPVPTRISLRHAEQRPAAAQLRVGLVGAGEFARSTLLPAMRATPEVALQGVVTASGLSAATVAQRFGFHYCASTLEELLGDDEINCMVIATRHNLHAPQVIAALQAGKDVFVEKPLALNEEELAAMVQAQQKSGRRLMVGFNRRFAPLVGRMCDFLSGRQRPLVATYRVNAGPLPPNHWIQDPQIGGGRIIGEACHFIDLLQFLTGAAPTSVYTSTAGAGNGDRNAYDETVLTITFADGSVGSVVYAAGGDASYAKERIEVFGSGRVAVLDDFRTLELTHGGHRQRLRSRPAGGKGHREEWRAFVGALQKGGDSPIPLEEAIATTLTTFRAMDSLRTGQPVVVDHQAFLALALADQSEGSTST